MISLPAIAAIVARILNLTLTLLGLARDQATAVQALQIQQTVTNSELELINLTHGLSAAYAQRVDILSRLTVLQASVDAIPTGPQLATDPVILPTTPPAGYGGSFGDTDLDAIWNYQYPPGSGNIVGDKLVKAGRGIEFLQQDQWYPHAYVKYLGHHYDTSNYYYEPSTYPLPIPDPSTILSTDASILDWANRTITAFDWVMLNNHVVSYSHTNISDEWWIITMSDLEFSQYKALAPSGALSTPLWPGLANVTLLTPHALVPFLDIHGVPMDGVLVELTEVDPHRSYYVFDGDVSYRNVGALAFYTDNGYVEYAQTLGFQLAIYVPKTMKRAAGCEFRINGIISGIVTPWVITPP